MSTPTLWIYEYRKGWAGHVDWKDGIKPKREGPFDTEAQAAVVISRMNGMQPPEDMLERWNQERNRKDES